MATMVPPQKNVEYIFYIGLVSQTDTKLLQNNPTLAAGDVLVSTDGGATSNLDTLPAVTPASSDMVKVTVSATEMDGDNIIIVFSDAAGAEWCDLIINIQTAAQSLDTTDTAVDGIQTDLSNVTDGLGALKSLIDAVQTTATAIDDLTKAAGGGDLAAVLAAIAHATYGLSAIRTRGDIAWITGGGGDATEANQLLLIKILTNKWEVVGNQLIMYDDDGTTPLYTFDLTQDGVPTEFNPDLRTPV